jgi:hypothetical protein
VALVAVAAVRRCLRTSALSSIPRGFERMKYAGAYALGIPASYWFFERLETLWPR